MKHKIENKNGSIHVNISQIESSRDSVIENLNNCKEGKCSCPTNEYEKLDSLEIQINDETDEIILDIEPKKGSSIKLSEIEKCLDYADKDK